MTDSQVAGGPIQQATPKLAYRIRPPSELKSVIVIPTIMTRAVGRLLWSHFSCHVLLFFEKSWVVRQLPHARSLKKAVTALLLARLYKRTNVP